MTRAELEAMAAGYRMDRKIHNWIVQKPVTIDEAFIAGFLAGRGCCS